MAGGCAAAKQAKLLWSKGDLLRASALAAQTWIGLQLVDDGDEVVEPDDPFELKACARIAGPDDIRLNTADDWKADDNAIAAFQMCGIVDHEAMRRKIADMQMHVALREMLDYGRKIDRMSGSAPQVGNTEISSTSHALRSFPPPVSSRKDCIQKADIW